MSRYCDESKITGSGDGAATLGDLKTALEGVAIPTAMICGTKIIADADVAEPLVDESTPCKSVWIGAPVTIEPGAAVNTKGVLVGNGTTQNFPIMPSNFEGKTFPIDDASKLWVKAGVDGESINYIIYR